jgi:hypothetical protein
MNQAIRNQIADRETPKTERLDRAYVEGFQHWFDAGMPKTGAMKEIRKRLAEGEIAQ